MDSESSDEEVFEDLDLDIIKNPKDEPGPSSLSKKRGRHNFITPKLVSVLDKCKISDRDAVRILIATAQALKHDVSNLVINATSIRRYRTQFRYETGKQIQDAFKNTEITAITVHWDGKILPALTGKEHVDRLPVVISFNGTEHILGIPAISAGTGKEQAIAVCNLLKEWDLEEKVEALCCDTTASNLGRIKGACVLLEQTLDKNLIYFPCRHHILALVSHCFIDLEMAGLN